LSTADSILASIDHSTFARLISKSNHMVIASLQIIHVVGLLMLLSTLLLMSLRLLGVTLEQAPVPQVTRLPTRLFWLGVTLAIVSGILMFIGSPAHYFYNRAFDLKMLLLLAALTAQLALFRRLAARDPPPSGLARLGVALSLLLWFGVGVAGRAIGFV
jgi:hypothetical protein